MEDYHYDIIVVGAGASGVFAAIIAKEHFPNLKICILEKTTKALSKVKISGGGRCNVTHNPNYISELSAVYPRGYKELPSVLNQFNFNHIIDWLSQNNIKLHTEADGRMFPTTNSSQTIIDCFLNKCFELDIPIIYQSNISKINVNNAFFELRMANGLSFFTKKLILSIGGCVTSNHINLLTQIGIKLKPTIPSLFSFNVPISPLKGLEGIAFNCKINLEGSKLSSLGPTLITHWGVSGPAVLKLSAHAAIYLFEKKYEYTAIFNFIPELSRDEFKSLLLHYKKQNVIIGHLKVLNLPARLMHKLISIANVNPNKKFPEITNIEIEKLIDVFMNFRLSCKGKTTYKEEFVSSGGVDRKTIDFKTMQSKQVPNLYFTGEMIDIDGITGGFNFQNAWSTAFIAGKNINF